MRETIEKLIADNYAEAKLTYEEMQKAVPCHPEYKHMSEFWRGDLSGKYFTLLKISRELQAILDARG